MKPVIAIDGPAASGKGTLGRMLAEHLHFQHLDSGMLYRSFACFELMLADHPEAVLDEASDSDSGNISDVCGDYDFLKGLSAIDSEKKWQSIFADWTEHENSMLKSAPTAHELVNLIRNFPESILKSEVVGAGASTLGKLPEVRNLLNGVMHEFAAHPGKDASGAEYDGTVIDGRDIGTVVFPDAACKIFITADLKTRAERRFAQEAAAATKEGVPVTFEAIYEALKSRDERDQKRRNAPLQYNESYDAMVDTSGVSVEEALKSLETKCKQILNV